MKHYAAQVLFFVFISFFIKLHLKRLHFLQRDVLQAQTQLHGTVSGKTRCTYMFQIVQEGYV